jgi:hypothetical protein
MTVTHNDHDASYKNLFSHPQMVQDLIQGFIHEPWVRDIDFSTLETAGSEYITDDLATEVRHQFSVFSGFSNPRFNRIKGLVNFGWLIF